MRQDHERLFDEFNPDDKGRASSSAIFATYLTAPTGINLDISPSGPPANATQPSPSSKESTNKLRGRRRSNLEMLKAFERKGKPRPVDMELGSGTTAPENAVDVEGLIQQSGRRILATSSRADQGTEAVGDAKDRINMKGFGAGVEGEQQTKAQGLEGRHHSDAAPAAADGVNQVEARTPPAMERNLFLSALANGKLEHHRNDVVITLKRVVAGGLAGMLAKSVVAPVDRVKILFQVTNETFSFKKAEKLFQDILALEGPAGLWKGNSATMIRVFPYAGTQFMMFDSLKRRVLLRKTRHDPNAEQRLSNMESLMSGSLAGATSALVTYPLDLARARLAVGHARKLGGRRRAIGVPELLRTVVRQDGFTALYRGVTPSLLGIIPYAGIAFSINEQAKHKVVVMTGKEPETFHKLGIGALAGLIAQSCTYPLEVTRRRMQTHGLIDAQAGVNKRHEMLTAMRSLRSTDYGRLTLWFHKVFESPKGGVPKQPEVVQRLNVFQTFKELFQEQGTKGMFKGLSVNWVKGPVAISISFTTFDFLKRQFGIS